MSDHDQAVESPDAVVPQQKDGPRERSKYEKNWKLDTQPVALYKKGDRVYLKGVRGVDPKPYKIYQVLGEAQYKLSRDGKSDGKAYRQEDLQTVP